MKQLIKSATVYKAEIPVDSTTLHNHLAERPFAELQPHELRTVGFVPIGDGCNLVETFAGGMAWRLRYDEKIIPAAAIAKECDKAIKLYQEQTGRKPNKAQRADIKADAIDLLARSAFSRTAIITCFHHAETGFLIVPTTSKKLSDLAVSLLIQAVGAVKTETLHVASTKKGLTAKLKQWLDDQPDPSAAFGDFHPCNDVALAQEKRRITVKMTGLEAASQGLREALTKGFEVTSMGFTHDDKTDFRLTDDFKLKSLSYFFSDDDQQVDDESNVFGAEAALEVDAVVAVVTELLELLKYKESEDAPALSGDDETTDATAPY